VGLKSSSSVHSHLDTLEERGYIRRDPAKPRSIEIMDDCFNLSQRELINIPILTTISSEQPFYAEENIEGYYPIPTDLLPEGEMFMLLVADDSMVKANISKDDKIIVKVIDSANDGDIIVTLVNDLPLIRRVFKENDYYRLQPENDSLEPILVDDIQIIGIVIGVFRLGIH
jgi:repressor LexA